ncbi:MAG: 23S rRNA (adenine(2503)-C(2))-methyltransferase RlmN [Proteobacteria bacterium]|nr:23S rRNA (adenine(2503)-C(2))-methyltransferase RlmN [Pseudomonadota bacterium]
MLKNLLNLDSRDLEEFFLDLGEKPFRARQLIRWMHKEKQQKFSLMTNLSQNLQKTLESNSTVETPRAISEKVAPDGTIKWLIEVDSVNSVETVFIPEKNRGTLCVSAQVGCALECAFCSTGRQGFNRNLTVAEIVGQLWFASKILDSNLNLSRTSMQENIVQPISNIVMMGMGEPLANYRNVVKAIQIMLDDNAYGYSRRRITLSTSGIVPSIDRLLTDCPVSLAVSLHAPDDDLRDQLVPINKKYPIKSLMEACLRYANRASVTDDCVGTGADVSRAKDYITFEYVMLAGVNDSTRQAKVLAALLSDVPCKVNLIPFNPFKDSGFKTSSLDTIKNFRDILKSKGYVCTIRKTRGQEIDSACGQLAGSFKDKTGRQSLNVPAL